MQNTLPEMADFEKTLDAAAMGYLQNKKRGGESGSKGTTYELIYLACKAANLLGEHEFKLSSEFPRLRWQLDGFVDDACVEYGLKTDFFQMKNSPSVSWTSGEHPICEDFRLQYVVTSAFGTPRPSTNLVVPDVALQTRLVANIPANIQPHSVVHYFPYFNGSLNRIVQEVDDVRESLKSIARSENPTIDELEGALGVLYLECMMAKGEGKSLADIYNGILKRHPGQIRLLDEYDLDKYVRVDFKTALARIGNLTYYFQRGFFNWSALGMSGAFGASCASHEFAEFQQKVVQQQPSTFDEFEEILS